MQVFLILSKLLTSVRLIGALVLISLNLKIHFKVIFWMQAKLPKDNLMKVLIIQLIKIRKFKAMFVN